MKITAEDLLGCGVCEKSISEAVGGAHNDMKLTAMNISEYLAEAVSRISKMDIDTMLENRYNKFRKIGMFSE